VKGGSSYPSNEFTKVSINDGLHDPTVDIGKPNTHVCSDHEQPSEDNDVKDLASLVRGHSDLEKFLYALEKHRINVTFAALYFKILTSSFNILESHLIIPR
jgi:hypothetical protein